MGYSSLNTVFEGVEVEVLIPFSNVQEIEINRDKDGQPVVSWLLIDNDVSNPFEDMRDFYGSLYTSRKGASEEEHANFKKHMGLDQYWQPDPAAKPNENAVPLDVYTHSGTTFSVTGEGQQCRFDTTKRCAIWVPSDDMLASLDGLSEEAKTNKLKDLARQSLSVYNDWLAGETYALFYAPLDLKSGRISDFESIGGFIGKEDALSYLNENIVESKTPAKSFKP